MAKKIKLVAKPLELEEIANYYQDSASALRLYFSDKNPKFKEVFAIETYEEVAIRLKERMDELDRSTSLTLLAALEAKFMLDCIERGRVNKSDSLSIALINYTANQKYSLLDDKILDIWKGNTSVEPRRIEDLKGIYKYRHWLAHGRHWTPKMARPDYDYATVYEIVQKSLNDFPFEGRV